MRRVLISVAEPSADLLAAELVAALGGQVRVEGLLGPRLLEAGATPSPGTVPMEGVMGAVEILRHLGTVRRNRAALRAALATRPDLFVTVDSFDLHFPLARAARALGIPTLGYVTPQVWAWRPGRARAVAAAYDQLLCLFPFEPPLFTRWGARAEWVGHPVVDRIRPSTRDPGVLALFPGSRPAEVRRHLRVFLAAAARLDPAAVWVALPGPVGAASVHPAAPDIPLGSARLVPAAEALSHADRALTKSGTVTLELAAAGIPSVVAHRVHPLTWWIGTRLVRGVHHLALPNILAGREVVPEFRQHLDPAALAEALSTVAAPPRLDLGPPGVADRAAAHVRRLLGGDVS